MSNKTLAIYGNYLSELDKTATLEKLGATLIKTSHTSASYRLFTAEDSQAMLCEDQQEGRKIRVEIWQLDSDAILQLFEQQVANKFLAKLSLSDGTSHFAFLAPLHFCLEHHFEDVSRFGGWERYLLKMEERKLGQEVAQKD